LSAYLIAGGSPPACAAVLEAFDTASSGRESADDEYRGAAHTWKERNAPFTATQPRTGSGPYAGLSGSNVDFGGAANYLLRGTRC
jgi:hypothetical protein